jgi:hypothetical protein
MDKFVVEARKSPKGNLVFDCEQPPAEWINGVTYDGMFAYYFRHHPTENTSSFDKLRDFFKTKSWYIRPKTW